MASNPWKMTQINELRRLSPLRWGGRLKTKEIAEMPEFVGHSAISIKDAIVKHGLADPIKSEACRKSRHLTDAERQILLDLLSGEGRHWPIEMIIWYLADKHGFTISNRTVKRHRQEHGLVVSHDELMADSTYQKWWAKLRRRIVKNHARQRKLVQREIRTKLREKKKEFAAMKNPPPSRSCKKCGRTYFDDDVFFCRRRYRKPSGELAEYRSSICVACFIPRPKA